MCTNASSLWGRTGGPALSLALALALAPGALPSAASAAGGGSARTGAFADLEPGGRGAALGGALTASVDDPSAIHWNPARLLHVQQPATMVTYADLFGLGLVRQACFFLALPRTERELSWEAGRVIDSPGPVRSAYGIALQSTSVDLDPESYTEYDLTLTMARRGWLNLAYGFAGHALLVRSDLEEVGAVGFSCDLALARDLTSRVSGSLVLRSLFSTLDWEGETDESLCRRAQVGIAGRLRDDLQLPVTATIDLERRELMQCAAGAEWAPVGEVLVLRGGLRWRDDGADSELRAAFGAGVCWRNVGFDYGLAAGREELGDTHRLSLQFKF